MQGKRINQLFKNFPPQFQGVLTPNLTVRNFNNFPPQFQGGLTPNLTVRNLGLHIGVVLQ